MERCQAEINILEGDSESSIQGISNRILSNNASLNEFKAWFDNPWGENVTDEDVNRYYGEIQRLNKVIAADKTLLETSTEKLESLNISLQSYNTQKENYYYGNNDGDKLYWNKTVFERPEQLNFWFDFLDSEGTISKYNTKVIGFRPKSINETSLKGIYFRETPSVIFIEDATQAGDSGLGYRYI